MSIENDVRELREKVYTMIRRWRQSQGKAATCKALIDALKEGERQDIAGE